MTPRPAIATTASSALLVAMATLPLREVFGDWGWTSGVIGGAAAGAGAAALTESLRPRLSATAASLLVVLGALLWTLVVPLGDIFLRAPLAGESWSALGDGMFSGWGALLEEQSPLSDPRSAEAFASILTWVAAAAAVHVAARRHSALAAIGTSAGILWISTAAALPRGLAPAIFGAGAGVAALLAISTITRAHDQRWRPGRIGALAAVVSLAGAAAALAGSASTSIAREPFDPRASRGTETVSIEVPDILAEYGVRRGADPARTVLTVDGSDVDTDLRLRLQVYETHDGERWIPAVDFQQVSRIAETDTLPPGDLVNLDVTIIDLDGPWIPLPDRLIDTDLTDLRWSDETQTAITAEPTTAYRVTGSVVNRVDLDAAESSRDEVPARLSEVPPGLPALIRDEAEEITADATDDLTAIDAITARVAALGRDESLAPGHSLARLRDDLEGERATGAEQIASLHALMLRTIGIPSRVVVGYVATSATVASADLDIWVEAAFPDVGWVAFDPVPETIDVVPDADDDAPVTSTTTSEDPVLQARAFPRELGPGEDPDQTAVGADGPLSGAGWALIIVTVVVLLLGSLVGARVLRRHLRRTGGIRPEMQVLGAWAEFVDRLRELGAHITTTTTIGDVVEIAASIDETLGDDARPIADLAAVALHAPDGSTPEEAAEMWDLLEVAETRITTIRGRRVVPLRYLDPRVFGYRAPKPPPSRHGGHRTAVTTP